MSVPFSSPVTEGGRRCWRAHQLKSASANTWKTTYALSWESGFFPPALGAAIIPLLIFELTGANPASRLTKPTLCCPLSPSEGKSIIIFLKQWLPSSQTPSAPRVEPWDCFPTWTFSRETTRPDSNCCHKQGVSTGSADSLFSSAPNGKIVWKRAWNVYQRTMAFSVNDEMTAN